MKINVTRRDLLKFGAGTAVGVMATPAPWKAIDDLAIWTQNWKWIPVPPKGPVTLRATTCSLCPAGCAVNARCIGGLPVSMHASAKEESLCALGLTGHHLPHHPSRLTAAARVMRTGGSPRKIGVGIDSIVSETRKAIADGRGSVALLDARPGRSSAIAWRSFLSSLPHGIYIPAPAREGASVATLASMLGRDPDSIAIDLGSARTIVSFGAPIGEGWGDARTMNRLLRRDPNLRLVQIEALRSRTASIAARWLPLLPGSEGVLALGFAHVLIAEKLVAEDVIARIPDYADYAALVARFTPEVVAAATRIPPSDIVATAREMVKFAPTVVVSGEEPAGGGFGRTTTTAIAGLNLLLGNIDAPGGIVHRDALPSPLENNTLVAAAELHEVADRSVSLLIVDASEGEPIVPWNVIEKKLVADHPLVVVLAPFFTGLATHATYVVPTPVFTEALHEVPSAFDSPRATLAVSAAIIQPKIKSHDPIAFLHALSGTGVTTSEELMRSRIASIHAAGKGIVTTASDGSSKPTSEFASADELWEALLAGGRWSGDAAIAPATVAPTLLASSRNDLLHLTADGDQITDARFPLTLIPHGTRDITASAAVSPVMTKIYQESGLRSLASTITINPQTAQQLRIAAGATVRLATPAGALLATLALDEMVMPGVVIASVGPDAAALGDGGPNRGASLLEILPAGATWRAAAASVVEA